MKVWLFGVGVVAIAGAGLLALLAIGFLLNVA